jgi:hypothetical protein
VNFYYYWVKEQNNMPSNSVVDRKNSTAFVSNLIQNPSRFDKKYYSVTDTNKL